MRANIIISYTSPEDGRRYWCGGRTYVWKNDRQKATRLHKTAADEAISYWRGNYPGLRWRAEEVRDGP